MNINKPNWTLHLAWLVAPTFEQQWEIFREISKDVSPVDFAIYCFWLERSTLGRIELLLRRFWLQVSLRIKGNCNA